MRDKIIEWFATGETGSSSKAMAYALSRETPNKSGPMCHPHDPADFSRCVKLLEAVPEAREHMDKVAAISPAWARLVEHWAELEALLHEEWPTGSAPKLYERMKELGC